MLQVTNKLIARDRTNGLNKEFFYISGNLEFDDFRALSMYGSALY